MDKVALLDNAERSAVFGETGAARGVANTIIEKDFWVCWTLKRLFESQAKDAPAPIFKGGTSLSKAFGAIRRFSEDIDLSFDRADLSYTGDLDPEKEGISKKQAGKLIEKLVGAVEQHIAEQLLPTLRPAIAKHLGEPTKGEWSLEIEANDPQRVNFHYSRGRRMPRVQQGYAHWLEIGGVARDDGQPVRQGRCGDESVAFGPGIGHMQTRALPRDGHVVGQDASGKASRFLSPTSAVEWPPALRRDVP